MRIVPQSAITPHTFLLALPAPSIAGLLPSGQLPPAPFVFDRPILADLSAVQRDRLYEATDLLLEIAIEHLIGTFNEDTLRAAEVVIHRAAGGTSEIRRIGPKAFNAELDADWLELLARAKRARPITPAEAESIVGQALGRTIGGAA